VDKETTLRALEETIEQLEIGLPLPTDRRITIEQWENYVVVHASFGSLVNRSLATLLGHLISEKMGHTVGVQEDPYRIIIQSSEVVSAVAVKEHLFELTSLDIRAVAEEALVNTGLFKRRMIHVARKFGAVSKWADFSNVSLSQLTKSFRDTAVFTEAVKETLAKDFDLQNLKLVLDRLKSGEVEVVTMSTEGEASPIAQVGLKKIGRRANLMTSDKAEHLIVESAKVRLLNEVKTFVCSENWDYVRMMPVKEFRDGFTCPKCGSKRIGVINDIEEVAMKLVVKQCRNLTNREKEIEARALRTGEMTAKYGAMATLVLAGRRLRLSEVEELLSSSEKVDDKLVSQIVAAERKALARWFL